MKQTATTRAPLLKVREDDIAPASELPSGRGNYTQKQRAVINNAMNLAKRRNNLGNKKRPLSSIHEYLDQKRSIFRVELVNSVIGSEIQQIAHKDTRRKLAIEQSEKELESDKTRALEFLNAKDAEEKNYKTIRENL